MPYSINKHNCVVKSDTGAVVKCHGTHAEAVAHLKALYANVPDAKEQSMSKNTQDGTGFMQAFNNLFALGKAKKPDEPESPAEAAAETPADEKREDAMDAAKHMAPGMKKDADTDKDDVEKPDTTDKDDVEDKKDVPQKSTSKEFTTQFSVYKQADDTYRWIGVTSSGFRDRDKQLVTSDALKADVARMNKEAAFGNLSFWHVMFKEENPATLDPGVALDIATCDASEMVSVSNVESGVFFDNVVGAAFDAKQKEMGFSREFFYPASEPDAQGNFNKIHTFRRTILPAGRASNLMSAETLSIAKESQEGKLAAFKEIVGAEKANEIVNAIMRKEKELESSGVEKKEVTVDVDTLTATILAKTKELIPPALTKDDVNGLIAAAFKEFAETFAKLQGEQMQSAKKEREDILSVVKELGSKVQELYGDAPHSLTKGWKPSEAAETILAGGDAHPAVAAAKKSANPRAELDAQPMGAMVNFMIAGSEGEQALYGRNGN